MRYVVVIPVLNELRYTTQCIESLLAHGTPAEAILVIDNGSSDGTPAWLAAHPEIRSVRNAVNHRKADITPRQRAMLDFAVKVTSESHLVGDADFAALREHGFSDDDAWDIAGIAALFGLSNRIANVSSMRPNDEFYLMGRVPRAKT